jgi:hypothetical protein
MTVEKEEEFRWAYSICRIDLKDSPPLQYFDRMATAKAAMAILEDLYPDIPLGVFVRGDQLYMGHPEIHENVH